MSFVAYGQFDHIDKKIDSIISLHKNDTLIYLTIQNVGRKPMSDTTFGQDKSTVFLRSIMLYTEGGKLYKQLMSNIYRHDDKIFGKEELLTSEPLTVDDEEILDLIRMNLNSFRDESVLPFVARKVNGQHSRNVLRFGSVHGTFYSLALFWPDGKKYVSRKASFSEFQLRPSHYEDINLNYDLNQQNNFIRLFKLIEKNQPFNF